MCGNAWSLWHYGHLTMAQIATQGICYNAAEPEVIDGEAEKTDQGDTDGSELSFSE